MQLALCSHDTGPVVVAHSERILDTGIMSAAVGHRSVQYSGLSANPAAVFARDVFAADEEGPIDITGSEVEDFVLSPASTVA